MEVNAKVMVEKLLLSSLTNARIQTLNPCFARILVISLIEKHGFFTRNYS
jgi:hypothetical protein